MECVNINVQTDIRFFQNIVWRKIQLLAPNVVSILPPSATFIHTCEHSLGGERVNCSTVNSSFRFFFFGDNLGHMGRFRGILACTQMLRLRKDDHKLSLNCTKSGLHLLTFELPITLQSNTLTLSNCTLWHLVKCMNQSWEREDFLVSLEELMLWANNSKGTCTETRRTGQNATNDTPPPTLERALPLQKPGANFHFSLPTGVFGYLKCWLVWGNMRYKMLEGK